MAPQPSQRPASPVEEDLQTLYNEVWAVFNDEAQATQNEPRVDQGVEQHSQGRQAASQPRVQQPPPQFSGRRPPPLQPTDYAVDSPKSATSRRRLPPTPGSATSFAPSFPMPEPEPYIPSSPAKPQLYNSTSYSSFSSAGQGELERRTTASSGQSLANGRWLPQAPASGSAMRSSFEKDERATLSTNTSFSGSSFASGSAATSVSTYNSYRPPGALAPNIPASYYSSPYAESTNPFATEDFNAYGDAQVHPTASQHSSYQHSPSHFSSQAPQLHVYTSDATNAPELPPKPSGYIASPAHSNDVYRTLSSGVSPYLESPARATGSQVSFFSTQTPIGQDSAVLSNPYHEEHDRRSYNPGPYEPGRDYYEPTIHDPALTVHAIANYQPGQEFDVPEQEGTGYWEEEEEDENQFVNFSLLSNLAMLLRDKVPRGTHVKGGIPYDRAFTGKDAVSTVQSLIQRELAINHNISTNDRRIALQVARSLQSQLFFFDVEWNGSVVQDGVDEVYMFLEDQEGGAALIAESSELPTGVITMLTRCYSPSCGDGQTCYTYGCPRKNNFAAAVITPVQEQAPPPRHEKWASAIDANILNALPTEEVERQNVIHRIIAREEQYLQDLNLVENTFIKPLRAANPPVIPSRHLEDFIDEVFGNILDLRECNKNLLEVLYVRQREEGPIILRIGDIFLASAAEFRYAYPTYIGHYPIAEKRLKEELEQNLAFRSFLEQKARSLTTASGDPLRLELKHFLGRPSEHLAKYPQMLELVLKHTSSDNGDGEFVAQAIDAIKSLQSVAQLRTFQAAMCKGTPGKWEWHDLVPADVREKFTKKQAKRQAIIFELIKGEMGYVTDMTNINSIFIEPLRNANPPIIPPDRVEQFIQDVFHNYEEILQHHKRLVRAFHEIQRDQHPNIDSITAPLFDAAINWRDAYLEYVPNYPIGAYRIDEEMATNPAFKAFVENCVRNPDANRLDMKNFINRPIPRLLRYELLLKGIVEETPEGHEDHETIPNVIDIIKSLGKETEPGVQTAKQKVEMWRYGANLVFKSGETIDMDLLNPQRSLVYYGKVLRQPESGLEWSGWSELFVLLFDNYLVMTKPKERDGVTKYYVNRRPIPLDLMTLVNFTDPPTQRSTGLLKKVVGGGNVDFAPSPEHANDSRSVYPFTLHYNGRMGGPCILYAESASVRNEWKAKLEHALGVHKIVQDSNKVFEIEYLSRDTFVMPPPSAANTATHWNQDNQYTGKVTCSVPFNTTDGRALVAIGCSEGVWIGFRHDPRSIRRVLHLKMVTQCAMLEDFGIFLVLADKALFAYHIEALVPSSPHGAHTSQVPQKLSGTKDVHFFSVGTLQGRTLIIYMKKKGLDSIFRVLEPVDDKIGGRSKAPAGFGSRLGFRSPKSEWFRVYRDFFLPSDAFDVIFLKARIAIFCAKGFEIMNLQDFDSITIPQREDPKYAQLARRCESAKPLGMFRSADDEFLLCYDEFGLFVDKHGDPSRAAGTIEWEGTAERVAFHAPHILLFDSRFIEIRHVHTGRLVQIIQGSDVRCVWDGRGIHSNQTATPAHVSPDEQQEAKVHFVVNSMDSVSSPGGVRSRNIVQHVCELMPTVPIYPQSAASTHPTGRPTTTYSSHGGMMSPTSNPTSPSGHLTSPTGQPGYSYPGQQYPASAAHRGHTQSFSSGFSQASPDRSSYSWK